MPSDTEDEDDSDDEQDGDSSHKPKKPKKRKDVLAAPPSGADKVRGALINLTSSSDEDKDKKKEKRQKEEDAKDDKKAEKKSKGDETPTFKERAQYAIASVLPIDPFKDEEEEKKAKRAEEKKKREDGQIVVNEHLDPSLPSDHPKRRSKVPVLEDKLFDADVATMTMYPAFFKGTLLRIVRATYFYSSMTDGSFAPIAYDEPLAKDLEVTYHEVKPWTRLPENEEAKEQQEEDKEDKTEKSPEKQELQPLPSMQKTSGSVRWESATSAKIFTVDLKGRLMSVVGGSLALRGFEEADRIAKQKSDRGFLAGLQSAMPWADDDDDDEEENQARKDRGETKGAHRQTRKAGASKVPSENPAQETGAGPDSDGPQGESFASRLLPTNENSVWLRPAQLAMRLTGMSKDDARAEDERREKDKNTQQALDGEPSKPRESSDGGEAGPDAIEEDLKDSPPELVLCVHGIGQELASDFDGLNFVYDVERMRKTSRKQSGLEEIRRLARGRRVQFLPICWRSGMSFDQQPEGNDNFFSLSDVSNDASIPFIRNVVSKVILDVPFYLSSHRKKMMDAVKTELNRIYRLFVVRNPDFEKKGGRVSLICHSLGSALGCDLLSQQPTKVKPLSEYTPRSSRSPSTSSSTSSTASSSVRLSASSST